MSVEKACFMMVDMQARDYMIHVNSTKSVTCDHCVKKLKKKIDKLMKFDRRRH